MAFGKGQVGVALGLGPPGGVLIGGSIRRIRMKSERSANGLQGAEKQRKDSAGQGLGAL
jgi:hypothetical protein